MYTTRTHTRAHVCNEQSISKSSTPPRRPKRSRRRTFKSIPAVAHGARGTLHTSHHTPPYTPQNTHLGAHVANTRYKTTHIKGSLHTIHESPIPNPRRRRRRRDHSDARNDAPRRRLDDDPAHVAHRRAMASTRRTTRATRAANDATNDAPTMDFQRTPERVARASDDVRLATTRDCVRARFRARFHRAARARAIGFRRARRRGDRAIARVRARCDRDTYHGYVSRASHAGLGVARVAISVIRQRAEPDYAARASRAR